MSVSAFATEEAYARSLVAALQEDKSMANELHGQRSLLSEQPDEDAEFRIVYTTLFVVFLIKGAIARLMPWRWYRPERPGGAKSFIEEVRETSGTVAKFAFMG